MLGDLHHQDVQLHVPLDAYHGDSVCHRLDLADMVCWTCDLTSLGRGLAGIPFDLFSAIKKLKPETKPQRQPPEPKTPPARAECHVGLRAK